MGFSVDRTAVVFIDFQRDVCGEGGRMVAQEPAVLAPFREARTAAGDLLDRLRAGAGPRHVFVQHAFEAGYPELAGVRSVGMERYVEAQGAFVLGGDGAAWVEELRPLAGEPVFTKTTISTFASTPLDRWLRRRGIDTVAIAGVVTHYAVLAAALAANDLGLRVAVLKDCCAAAARDRHETVLSILAPLAEIVTAEEFLTNCEGSGSAT